MQLLVQGTKPTPLHSLSLPAAELKRLKLSGGDLLLLHHGGRGTVAPVEQGDRLLVSASVAKALQVQVGEEIEGCGDFEAQEASSLVAPRPSRNSLVRRLGVRWRWPESWRTAWRPVVSTSRST